MKKSIYAILSLMLVLMLSVAMIPAVSAAGESLTIKNENEDFSFEIYQIATISTDDLATGKYTCPAGLAAAAKTAVNTANQSGADFLAALDAIETIGITPVATVSGKTGTGYETTYTTTTAGIYYARVKDQPAGNVAKVSNSVIVWPTYVRGSWDYTDNNVDLATKVGTDNVTKSFSDTTADSKAAGQGDTIQFTLKADVVGSATDKATKYQIWDKMSPGLEYVANSAHVFYDGTTTSADNDFEVKVEKNNSNEAKYGNGTIFTFSAKAATLANESSAYYSAKEVYVTYSATVLNTAGIGSNYNPNKDGLIYKLASSTADVERDGREVKVYTYTATATKIDASATAKATGGANVPLAGAVIGLYKDGTEIARGTSAADGTVVFKNGTDENSIRLAPGSYVVKEITAPNGYALSTVEYPLTITDNAAARSGEGVFSLDGNAVIENFATKLPETGGQGTLMFTIIGAALILCAGTLFVLIMKKKSCK